MMRTHGLLVFALSLMGCATVSVPSGTGPWQEHAREQSCGGLRADWEPIGGGQDAQQTEASDGAAGGRRMPSFPDRAKRRGIDRGVVIVAFDVDERGRVRAPRVLFSEPRGVFSDAALHAIAHWRLPVAEASPHARRVPNMVRFRFQLDDAD